MPVVSFNTIPTKGTAGEMQLDKAELISTTSIGADPYYSIQTNWKRVLLHYESSVENQKIVVTFNATQATPLGNFLASVTALDVHEIDHIIVQDFDHGYYRIERAELVPAEFDVNLASIVYAPFSDFTMESTQASPGEFNLTSTGATSWSTFFWYKYRTVANGGENLTLGNNIGSILSGADRRAIGMDGSGNATMTDNINNQAVNTGVPIDDGEWHHIGMTHLAGSPVDIYLDGVLYFVGTDTPSINFTMDEFSLGSGHTIPNFNSKGWTAEATAWNIQLSGSDVTALYNAGAGLAPEEHAPTLANIVHSFKMGDSQGVGEDTISALYDIATSTQTAVDVGGDFLAIVQSPVNP